VEPSPIETESLLPRYRAFTAVIAPLPSAAPSRRKPSIAPGGFGLLIGRTEATHCGKGLGKARQTQSQRSPARRSSRSTEGQPRAAPLLGLLPRAPSRPPSLRVLLRARLSLRGLARAGPLMISAVLIHVASVPWSVCHDLRALRFVRYRELGPGA
jgi:hypothetical protein